MTAEGSRTPRRANTGDAPRRRPLTSAIREKFREVVRRLTAQLPTPQPQKPRRKGGETEHAFRKVARSILRPILRVHAIAATDGFLHDAFDWLRLWNGDVSADDGAGLDNYRETNENNLAPKL
jgi:hypothetical protein